MTPDAAVQRIADDRMSDRAEVHTDLVGPARMDREVRERERRPKPLGPHNAGDGLAAAAGLRRHSFPVRRIAADRRIDAAASLDQSPDESDVLFLHLSLAKLA